MFSEIHSSPICHSTTPIYQYSTSPLAGHSYTTTSLPQPQKLVFPLDLFNLYYGAGPSVICTRSSGRSQRAKAA